MLNYCHVCRMYDRPGHRCELGETCKRTADCMTADRCYMRAGAARAKIGQKKADDEDAADDRVRMAMFGDENAASVDDLDVENLTTAEDGEGAATAPGGAMKIIYADFESSIKEQTKVHKQALIIVEE